MQIFHPGLAARAAVVILLSLTPMGLIDYRAEPSGAPLLCRDASVSLGGVLPLSSIAGASIARAICEWKE
jgi:hypothetical protein